MTRNIGMKKYTLAYLLSKQPKTLRKDPRYQLLTEYFVSSSRLSGIRISSRCYKLLNRASVDPENLKYFYRTYRLPEHPFFPLFFAVKRNYLNEQRRRKAQRENDILSRMRSLPADINRFIRLLAEWEKSVNPVKDYPFWSRELYPRSKKKAEEYISYSRMDWILCFENYLRRFRKYYRNVTEPFTEKLLACFVLELIPRGYPFRFPDIDTVKKQYRILSKKYHPDTGGSDPYFIRLNTAKSCFL